MFKVVRGKLFWKIVHKLNGMEVYFALTRDDARAYAKELNKV